VSSLPARGFTADRIVALAFHVDYWNDLGWVDRFAQSRFSERQRWTSARNHMSFVYTPQLILNGRDYSRSRFHEDFADRIRTINAEKPTATILLKQEPARESIVVTGKVIVRDATYRDAQAYLALYENHLSSEVTAGENQGEKLTHDFVVRILLGPLTPTKDGRLVIHDRFSLANGWNRRELHLAAFVQDRRSAEVLQSLSAPLCR